MGKPVKVILNPMNKVVEVEEGTILLDAIRMADVNIRCICGGHGECGTCKVIVERGEVEDISLSLIHI